MFGRLRQPSRCRSRISPGGRPPGPPGCRLTPTKPAAPVFDSRPLTPAHADQAVAAARGRTPAVGFADHAGGGALCALGPWLLGELHGQEMGASERGRAQRGSLMFWGSPLEAFGATLSFVFT